MAVIPWHADTLLKVVGQPFASSSLWAIVEIWNDLSAEGQAVGMAVICTADIALYRRPPTAAGTALTDSDLRMLAKKRPRQL